MPSTALWKLTKSTTDTNTFSKLSVIACSLVELLLRHHHISDVETKFVLQWETKAGLIEFHDRFMTSSFTGLVDMIEPSEIRISCSTNSWLRRVRKCKSNMGQQKKLSIWTADIRVHERSRSTSWSPKISTPWSSLGHGSQISTHLEGIIADFNYFYRINRNNRRMEEEKIMLRRESEKRERTEYPYQLGNEECRLSQPTTLQRDHREKQRRRRTLRYLEENFRLSRRGRADQFDDVAGAEGQAMQRRYGD